MARKKIISPLGPEPAPFSYKDDDYKIKLGRALDWYNFECDKSQGRVFLKSYLELKDKTKLTQLTDVTDSRLIPTFLWLARMVTNGTELSPAHQNTLDINIDILFKTNADVFEEELKPKKAKVISIQDRIRQKADIIIGELEGALDDFIDSGKELNLLGYLTANEVPPQYCSYVKDWLVVIKDEFIEVYNTDDPQLKEGYSNIKRSKLTKIINFVSKLEQGLDKYVGDKKAKRTTKPKRSKSPMMQIAKVKYCKEFPELNLKSIQPVNIIGASQVWIYNVKYKKLIVMRTDASSGLQVNGTSIINYDPDNSEQKTLRKPQEVLPLVLEAGKIPLRKLMNDINSKEGPAKNRLNENCIILRALK